MDTLTCYLTPQSGEVLTLTAPLHPAAEALIMGQITDSSGPCAEHWFWPFRIPP